ncbi:MAG: InlB B-repeat-containing protein [Bacilli bacterium]|nr:InlB B-repeat-containing protein [Bacilli bacterium]
MKKKLPIIISLIAVIGLSSIAPLYYSIRNLNTSAENLNLQKQCVINYDSNGGNNINKQIYVVGDVLTLPTPTKSGFTFAGWYFDNNTFERRCNNYEDIFESTTLFAKWVVKPIKIYFDTFYENEFEPIIKECGETFHLSEAPKARRKEVGRLQYPFKMWKNVTETQLTEDFVVKDQYYAFHAFYGSPEMDDKYVVYENKFDNDCGYIDSRYSWHKVLDWTTYDYLKYDGSTIPTYVNANIAATRETRVSDNELILEATTNGYHFVDTGVYLPEVAYRNGNQYCISLDVKVTKKITSQDANSKIFDSGFGIATRINDSNKAYVATMYDPNASCLRVGALDKNKDYSREDINSYCYYNLPTGTNVSSYHNVKVVVQGVSNNTTMTAYFDNNLAFTYSDTTCDKTWFKDSATGSKIALFANSCNVSIKNVKVTNPNQTDTYYESDFSIPGTNFADGWLQDTNSTGSNNGEYFIENGSFYINDAYKMTQYHHQAIFAPIQTKLKDYTIGFDLTFNELSGEEYNDPTNSKDSKYLSVLMRCGDPNTYDYGALTFRQSGNLLTYHHTGPAFSTWNSVLHTYRSKSDANMMKIGQTYKILIILENDVLTVFIDDVEIGTFDHQSSNMFTYEEGRIGFLASSINLKLDNLRVTSLMEEI